MIITFTQNKDLLMKFHIVILTLILSVFLVSCAHYPPDRYNTQAGAVTGAGMGALIGQAIGGNTQGTLIGLAAGTILGALVGNAIDQDYQAARDAAQYGKRVIYYDKDGHAVEAIPEESNNANCRQVRERVWENGKMVKETVEEVCTSPPPVVQYYPPHHLLLITTDGGDGRLSPTFPLTSDGHTPMVIIGLISTDIVLMTIDVVGIINKFDFQPIYS